jgi:hypothetical protein
MLTRRLLVFGAALALVLLCGTSGKGQTLVAPGPLTDINARYVNGFFPGYRPMAGAGLVLNISLGSSFCGGSMVTYAGGTLTMAAVSTNYVYLDTTAACAPSSNTTGFSATAIPLAVVTTGGASITGVVDDRTFFVQQAGGGSGSPGGSTTAVQFNNSGSFAGDATNFFYTASSHALTATGGFVGNLTGNASGSAASFTGSLAGDVTGTQGATSVGKVNGVALPVGKIIVGTNGSGQIVDASAAMLSNSTTGNAATATTATNFSGTLAGDVTGTQSATLVGQVNGAPLPAAKKLIGTNGSGQIIDSSSATLSNNTTGNAATATALANLPTLCPVGQAPTGVLANGNATGCALIGGGAPGGSTTAVQFNSSGSFGGDATNFFYNSTSHVVTATGGFSGNATTSSALAALPSACGAGEAAAGILANGNATGCFTPAGSGTVNASPQYSVAYYPNSGSTTTVGGLASPTTPGNYLLGFNGASGSAVAPSETLVDALAVPNPAGWTHVTATWTPNYSYGSTCVDYQINDGSGYVWQITAATGTCTSGATNPGFSSNETYHHPLTDNQITWTNEGCEILSCGSLSGVTHYNQPFAETVTIDGSNYAGLDAYVSGLLSAVGPGYTATVFDALCGDTWNNDDFAGSTGINLTLIPLPCGQQGNSTQQSWYTVNAAQHLGAIDSIRPISSNGSLQGGVLLEMGASFPSFVSRYAGAVPTPTEVAPGSTCNTSKWQTGVAWNFGYEYVNASGPTDLWTSSSSYPGALPTWSAHNTALGTSPGPWTDLRWKISDGTTNCGGGPCIQWLSARGVSGASAPSWNASIGGTTADGTAQWTNGGPLQQLGSVTTGSLSSVPLTGGSVTWSGGMATVTIGTGGVGYLTSGMYATLAGFSGNGWNGTNGNGNFGPITTSCTGSCGAGQTFTFANAAPTGNPTTTGTVNIDDCITIAGPGNPGTGSASNYNVYANQAGSYPLFYQTETTGVGNSTTFGNSAGTAAPKLSGYGENHINLTQALITLGNANSGNGNILIGPQVHNTVINVNGGGATAAQQAQGMGSVGIAITQGQEETGIFYSTIDSAQLAAIAIDGLGSGTGTTGTEVEGVTITPSRCGTGPVGTVGQPCTGAGGNITSPVVPNFGIAVFNTNESHGFKGIDEAACDAGLAACAYHVPFYFYGPLSIGSTGQAKDTAVLQSDHVEGSPGGLTVGIQVNNFAVQVESGNYNVTGSSTAPGYGVVLGVGSNGSSVRGISVPFGNAQYASPLLDAVNGQAYATGNGSSPGHSMVTWYASSGDDAHPCFDSSDFQLPKPVCIGGRGNNTATASQIEYALSNTQLGGDADFVRNTTTGTVTIQPLAAQDAPSLALAPKVLVPTAHVLDVYSAASLATDAFWVGSGSAGSAFNTNVVFNNNVDASVASWLKIPAPPATAASNMIWLTAGGGLGWENSTTTENAIETAPGAGQSITNAASSTFGILNSAVGDIPLTINAMTGQTANLQVWRVNGVNEATMSAAGGVTVSNVTDSALTPGDCVQAGTGGILTSASAACGSGSGGSPGGSPGQYQINNTTFAGSPALTNTTAAGTSSVNVQPTASDVVPLIVKDYGTGTPTSDLTDWYCVSGSAASKCASVSSTGAITAGGSIAAGPAAGGVGSEVGLPTAGTTPQTCSGSVWFYWTDSADSHIHKCDNGTDTVTVSGYPGSGVAVSTGSAWGTSLAVQGTDSSVLSSGTIGSGAGNALCTDASGGATTSGCGSVTGAIVSNPAVAQTITDASATTFTVTNSAATDTPLTVQGFSGQSANLQNWKDSSGSTKASISSTGALNVASFNCNTSCSNGPGSAANTFTIASSGTSGATNVALFTLASGSSTGAGNAGVLAIKAGTSSGAGTQGIVHLDEAFTSGTIGAVGDIVCETVSTPAYQVGDCALAAVNWVGIATATSGAQNVIVHGVAQNAQFDATTVTTGDVACAPIVGGTAGKLHDNGTASCSVAGTTVGVIVKGGSSSVGDVLIR